LGFGRDQLRLVPIDDNLRMDVQALAEMVCADRANGLRPLAVIATAGTTSTGTVDLLVAIRRLCDDEDLWMHVDGAYGGAALIGTSAGALLDGLGTADSLVLDPHKWLFQPYDVGALLVSRPGALERCFAMTPEYLKDVHARSGEVDFRNRSLELSRRSRALKLWMTFRSYGIDQSRAAIGHGMALAEFAGTWLAARPETWEVVSPPALGIVCFALRGADAAEHEVRAGALAASGFACVSTTVLKGRSVLRLCTINPLTTEADIAGTLERLGDGWPR